MKKNNEGILDTITLCSNWHDTTATTFINLNKRTRDITLTSGSNIDYINRDFGLVDNNVAFNLLMLKVCGKNKYMMYYKF